MRKIIVLSLFLPVLQGASVSTDRIRSSAQRAITAVERGTAGFYKTQECFSCHDLGLPMLAFRLARERGLAVDEANARQIASKGLSKIPDLSSLDRAVQDNMLIDPAASDGWAMISANAAGLKPNLVTGVYARRLALWQRSDGHWSTTDARPPQSYSPFTATAAALRAVQLYMPQQLRQEVAERTARARAWLFSAKPTNTEDHTFRLYGLFWAGASASETARAAQELLSLQKPNGGWSQLPHLEPDAYSTGEALAALGQAGGMAVSSAAFQKGLQFLLTTQDDAGAWHVPTRMISPAPISPPYLESGFPYGHDQFLSTDGTCWAAMALMLALPPAAGPSASPLPLPSLAPKGVQPWMEKAIFGTAADFKAQLDSGLDPNIKTQEGTTLAMMVAHDAAKLKLLADRGADVKAKAKTGFTALMVAATYPGTAESVKVLLSHGAEARPGAGVQFNASPLFLAAIAGDRENIALLLAKGADPNRKMVVMGFLPGAPLVFAAGYDDAALIRTLAGGGADINAKDQDGMTALDWAVLSHHAETVKALLASGAGGHINEQDRFGYTPLHYAATVDFGDAGIVNVLLKAGADPHIKDKDGKTALAHARQSAYLRAALEKGGEK